MIRIAFIVKARAEVAWYGLEMPVEEKERMATLFGSEKDVELIEGFENVFGGPVLSDPARPGDDLEIHYYFPDEEPGDDLGLERRVDLAKAGVISRKPARKKCGVGFVYACGGDWGDGYEDLRVYETGFFPPFKSEDVTLVVEDLSDFGFEGWIVSEIRYDRAPPAHVETEARIARRLDTRFLA